MKYLITLLIVAIGMISCQSEKDNLTLTGNVKGLSKGTLYLEQLRDTVLVAVDSAVIDGEANFSMNLFVEEPEVYFLYVAIDASQLNDERLPIFLEPGSINVSTNLNNFMTDARVTGSQNHDAWYEYQKSMKRYNDQQLELIQATLEAQQKQQDSLAQQLSKQQESVLRGKYFATVNFAKNNSDKAIAPYLMLTEAAELNTKYLDTVYGSLTAPIKETVYGKGLNLLIEARKKAEAEQQ